MTWQKKNDRVPSEVGTSDCRFHPGSSAAESAVAGVAVARPVVAGAEEGPVTGEIPVGIRVAPGPAVAPAAIVAAAKVISRPWCVVGSRVVAPSAARIAAAVTRSIVMPAPRSPRALRLARTDQSAEEQ